MLSPVISTSYNARSRKCFEALSRPKDDNQPTCQSYPCAKNCLICKTHLSDPTALAKPTYRSAPSAPCCANSRTFLFNPTHPQCALANNLIQASLLVVTHPTHSLVYLQSLHICLSTNSAALCNLSARRLRQALLCTLQERRCALG